MCSRSSDRLRRRIGLASLAALFLPLASGCGAISMAPPEGFATISRGASELKAVSSDDALIWVRSFDEPHPAGLAFWAETVRNDFVENRGYTLLDEEPVVDGAGNEGRLCLYETTVGGSPHRYIFALFLLDRWPSDTIVAVEFAAPKPVFEKHIERVKGAIATLEP